MAATDPVSLGIAAAAAVTAALAAWFQVRRAPALDGERWLKATLATLLRGHTEAHGGDASAWARAVRTQIPYHPAGREPERKILHPAAQPTAALVEGEQALLEALRRATDPADRWAVLYDGTDEIADALLEDPIELGPSYAPASVLGPGTTWDDVATWATDPTLGERLAERHPLVWACFHEGPEGSESEILTALADVWPHTVRIGPGDDAKERIEPAFEVGRKLVLAAEGDAIVRVLEVMKAYAGLRDEVVAVVCIGGPIRGREGGPDEVSPKVREDWMGRWYTQLHLDTEDVRLTPYMALQWLDRTAPIPGTARQPLAGARFPEPASRSTDVQTIESVDLGPLPRPGGPDDTLLAKALLWVVAGWVAQRG